jgi:cytochrome d ubiquinol oxidase subunit I
VLVYAIVFGAGIRYLFKLVQKGPRPHEPAPDAEHGERTPMRPLSVGERMDDDEIHDATR